MKKVLSIMLLCLMLCIGTAYAESFWTGAVWNNQLGAFVPNIMNFDWSSSGSGNAQGIGPAGTIPVSGTNFDFRYQSYLFAVQAPDGNSVSFPGLNTTFEYTVVALIPETVVSGTDLGGGVYQAVFKTLSGGVFYIYHDASPNANVVTGTGFDDGILVASGTIDPDQISTFLYNGGTGTGLGSAILFGKVNYANSTYLNLASTIVGFRVEGTLNYPPLDSSTTAYFKSRAGEGNLPEYSVGSNDLALKVDTSSKFLENVECCIDIEKYVSVDPPTNPVWYDADTCGEVPVQLAPHNAMYKLVVTNCGNIALTNVTITDSTLGINQPIANLAPGEVRELKGTEIPELGWEERCTTTTTIENTAVVNATCSDSAQTPVSDQDSACWQCEQLFGGCRMTGGHNTVEPDGSYYVVPGGSEVIRNVVSSGKKNTTTTTEFKYTVGGQIGAPEAGCCTPGVDCASGNGGYGEWEHSHHENGTLKFSFHAGTHSAPSDSYIQCITCTDPGWCVQARCAPFKQIFWEGTGVFQNPNPKSDTPFKLSGCTIDPNAGKTHSLHYYQAHVGDFGEPGNTGKQKSWDPSVCGWTSGGVEAGNTVLMTPQPPVPDPKFGDKGGQSCDACPDWYEIEVHCTANPSSPIIYRAAGYLTGGNHQIHPEVGQQCPF